MILEIFKENHWSVAFPIQKQTSFEILRNELNSISENPSASSQFLLSASLSPYSSLSASPLRNHSSPSTLPTLLHYLRPERATNFGGRILIHEPSNFDTRYFSQTNESHYPANSLCLKNIYSHRRLQWRACGYISHERSNCDAYKS